MCRTLNMFREENIHSMFNRNISKVEVQFVFLPQTSSITLLPSHCTTVDRQTTRAFRRIDKVSNCTYIDCTFHSEATYCQSNTNNRKMNSRNAAQRNRETLCVNNWCIVRLIAFNSLLSKQQPIQAIDRFCVHEMIPEVSYFRMKCSPN